MAGRIRLHKWAFPNNAKETDTTDKIKAKRKKAHESQAQRKAFDQLCLKHDLPIPVHEYEFAREIGRKWRFDWLFQDWLAVEQVGGVWVHGHHSRGQEQINDMEKRNHAVLLGYSVLEFTPQQFESGEAFEFIKKVLEARCD